MICKYSSSKGNYFMQGQCKYTLHYSVIMEIYTCACVCVCAREQTWMISIAKQ